MKAADLVVPVWRYRYSAQVGILAQAGSQSRAVAKQIARQVPINVHSSSGVLYLQLSELTMLGPAAFTDNVQLARRGRLVEGDLVECGTWRGGMSAAMAWAVPGRHSVLFDSFEGVPDAKPIDGATALHWSANERDYDNCTAEERWAVEAMDRVKQSDREIIKGWFEDTVPVWAKRQRPIAVLRLDGDWYDSTMICLEHLWPLVAPGGLVIIDDYYTWDGCSRAVHDYLSRTQASERIERTKHGVAYLVRRAE